MKKNHPTTQAQAIKYAAIIAFIGVLITAFIAYRAAMDPVYLQIKSTQTGEAKTAIAAGGQLLKTTVVPSEALSVSEIPTNKIIPSATETLNSSLSMDITPTHTVTNTLVAEKAKVTSSSWHGKFYKNTEFTEPFVYERDDDTLSFDWKKGNPAPGVPVDNFSVRWTRCMEFEERYYTFRGQADDYLRIYVDDIFVVEARGQQVERDFMIGAGQHCIRVDYAEGGENAWLYFTFEPSTKLAASANPNPWHGKFYKNTEFTEPFVYERDDDTLSFDWKKGNPAPGVPVDNFSVRWTRCMEFEERHYTFRAQADDYLRIYVNDIFVVEARGQQVERDFMIGAGQHCIKVDYAEGGENASLFLSLE